MFRTTQEIFLVVPSSGKEMQFGEKFYRSIALAAIDNFPSGIIDLTSFSMSWHLHRISLDVDFSLSLCMHANR